MQYVGEKLHQGVRKGFEFAGASRQSAEVLATGTLDVVNIATAGKAVTSVAKPVLNPALTTAKSGVRSVVDTVSRVELRVDPLRMGTAGGNVSLGLKPKVEVPTSVPVTKTAATWSRPMEVARPR